ncbi:hypothetical protein E4U61_005703 [Claviceps capensis]|nr:hypothetical protein E4U61_005703 [Claviceps capensis]
MSDLHSRFAASRLNTIEPKYQVDRVTVHTADFAYGHSDDIGLIIRDKGVQDFRYARSGF